jgi:putative oxidoreductase
MLTQLPEGTRSYAVLAGRVLLGVVMFAFGWGKWVTNGLSATAAGMGKLGVPFPILSATFAGTVELVGGVLLILGALTAVVGVLMVLDMAGAIVTTHQYVSITGTSGMALPGAVLAGALVFAAVGAGRFSVDHLLIARQHTNQPSPIWPEPGHS